MEKEDHPFVFKKSTYFESLYPNFVALCAMTKRDSDSDNIESVVAPSRRKSLTSERNENNNINKINH